MTLFDYLTKLDEHSSSYHFEVENEGTCIVLKLEVEDGGFFSRYNVRIRVLSRGSWEVNGLPDGDAEALMEAYDLAERHGTRSRSDSDSYTFSLDEIVELIADVR